MESRLNKVLQIPKRKLIVSLNDISLNRDGRQSENVVFVLMVEESPGSAGGRGGGSGNRKIDKIMGFRIKDSKDVKIFETENPDVIEKFDIPYNAVAMDIVLESGDPFVVQGVVDDDLVQSYLRWIE
ncbi:MAG: hypothetical protein H0U27_01235 [Nitrosopumilus sp.]|nr:hypothetical protein [Nitrosopumilus sp.]